MKRPDKHIAVIGDGGWGTTLAIHCQRKGFPVTLWGPFTEYVRFLKKTRTNKKFLPGVKIPRAVRITDNLGEAVEANDLIILAIPSKYVKGVINRLKKFDLSQKIFLSVAKGIEPTTLERVSQIMRRELKGVQPAVLSGPTIAGEVVRGVPSSAVVACPKLRTAQALQRVLNTETFRIYTNTDMAGVEIGGSAKNVIAIACGLCDGLGYGSNTKAALLTRGLAEIARLGVAMGGKARTFAGLSGLGDLVTTCFSPHSRNRTVGEKLARGRKIGAIISGMDMVAEGVTTVKALNRLRKKHNVSMPITHEVYNIIYRDKAPRKAVRHLMNRKLKSE